MFGNLFSGWHLVILVALVLLLFGATKLPALARGIGQSVRILREERRRSQPDDGPSDDGPSDDSPGAEKTGADERSADEPRADPPQRD